MASSDRNTGAPKLWRVCGQTWEAGKEDSSYPRLCRQPEGRDVIRDLPWETGLCLSWFDRIVITKILVSELLCHLPVGWKVRDLAGEQLGWHPSRPLWLPGWTQFCLPHIVPSCKDANHIGLRSKPSSHFHLITPWGPFIWQSQLWGTRGLGLQLVNLGQGVCSSQPSLRRLYL